MDDNALEYDGCLYRAFYCFVDAEMERAEIPRSWINWFRPHVTNTAVWKDNSKNSFNIFLSRELGVFAFTRGLKQLLQHYDLPLGAWVRLFYLGECEFQVQMMNRELILKRDPHPGPNHYEFGWSDSSHVDDPYNSEPDDDEWNGLECSDVTICASHLVKNRKVLPAQLVKDAIFPIKPLLCVLRDKNSGRFFCQYQFRCSPETCTLTLGWLDFVMSNNLTESSVATFGIKKGDPSIIHVKVKMPEAKNILKTKKFSITKKIDENRQDFKGKMVVDVKFSEV